MSPGYGARTIALIATMPDVAHRFSALHPRVCFKLFKGPSKEYLKFHRDCFGRLEVLRGARQFQQSTTAGTTDQQRSYAVLEYIEGDLLRSVIDSGATYGDAIVCRFLSDLILRIWVPDQKEFHPAGSWRTGSS